MFEGLVIAYVTKRLTEPSTYLGLVALVASHFAIHFDPGFQSAVIQALMDLGAVIAIVLKDGGHVWVPEAVQIVQPVHPAGSMTTEQLNEESAHLKL